MLEATILEAGKRKALSNRRVLAYGPNDQIVQTTSDDTGRFEFRGLDEGSWTLEINSDAHRQLTEKVNIRKDQKVELTLYLTPDRARANETIAEAIIVEERRDNSELVERNISAAEIQFLPGSNGDVIKAVQNLPGIAEHPLGLDS